MSRTTGVILTFLLLVISGCASKEALIAMRKETKDPDALKSNIEKINDILAEESSDALFFAEAMKTGMILSRDGGLSAKFSADYNKLIDNFQSIREKDRIVHSAFSFGEKNDLGDYNAYTKDYAIYCLANAGGSRMPDEIINVLYTLSQYDKRRAIVSTLDGLKQHIDKLYSNKKLAAKALVGLARFRSGKQLTNDEASLIASLENDLVTLDNLSYIYNNSHRYLKTSNQYSYVFALNSALFATLLNGNDTLVDKSSLKENLIALMEFSKNEDIDQVYRDRADRVLLNYAPVAYYDLMYQQKDKPNALLKLISLYNYTKAEDDASAKSEGIAYTSESEANQGRKYLNHRAIFGPGFFTEKDSASLAYFISALDGTMKNESFANHTFYYSHMIEVMPDQYVDHILKEYKKSLNHADLVNRFDFAIRLTAQDKKLDEKRVNALYDASLWIYKNLSPEFDDNAYTQFHKHVMVYLAKNRTKSFINDSIHLLNKKKKIASKDAFTVNFIYALEQHKHALKQYEGAYKNIFAFHDETSSKYLTNYLLGKDINYLHQLYISTLMNNNVALWELSMIGNTTLTHKKRVNADVKKGILNKFITLVSIKDDDRSLISAHYAKALGGNVSTAMQKRYSGIKL